MSSSTSILGRIELWQQDLENAFRHFLFHLRAFETFIDVCRRLRTLGRVKKTTELCILHSVFCLFRMIHLDYIE